MRGKDIFLFQIKESFFYSLSTAICWETSLHIFAICLSNFILSSTVTPNISRSSVIGIAVFSQ